ncbi:MAG: hypothetical protein EI684_00265 [Candidatus Viridilinea halotolerans]|uniref:Uncharacterized protein n=1 Tax=Candidatus Viridilinea halotolerans TaxID=2491704 RepID=A0A426UCG7_9CHLR|nr:MAG: hypothetical protein EI684_00265 [Candidatus Viridilinea halotolerans]
MAMIESAYEVREAADYLIAGQNLLFTHLPYQNYLRDLDSDTTPETLTRRIVERYNPGPSAPYTISALDLRQLWEGIGSDLPQRINTLAALLLAELPNPTPANHPLVLALTCAYSATQKFGYDTSGTIDEREGYVDLVGFARHLSSDSSLSAAIRAAGAAVAVCFFCSVLAAKPPTRSRNGFFGGGEASPKPPPGAYLQPKSASVTTAQPRTTLLGMIA